MDFRAVDDGGKSVGREPLHYGRWEAIIVGCVPKRSCFQGVGGALTETIPTRKGKETTLSQSALVSPTGNCSSAAFGTHSSLLGKSAPEPQNRRAKSLHWRPEVFCRRKALLWFGIRLPSAVRHLSFKNELRTLWTPPVELWTHPPGSIWSFNWLERQWFWAKPSGAWQTLLFLFSTFTPRVLWEPHKGQCVDSCPPYLSIHKSY